MWEFMKTENVSPDRFTYSALIKAAGAAADAARLRQLYQEACLASGGPDGFIFSALFNSAAQCSGLDSHWLLQVRPDICSIDAPMSLMHPYHMLGCAHITKPLAANAVNRRCTPICHRTAS